MPIVKVIELVGTSKVGWEDAARNAVKEAGKTVRNIVGVEIVGMTAKVEGGEISEYRADVKVAFLVEGRD